MTTVILFVLSLLAFFNERFVEAAVLLSGSFIVGAIDNLRDFLKLRLPQSAAEVEAEKVRAWVAADKDAKEKEQARKWREQDILAAIKTWLKKRRGGQTP